MICRLIHCWINLYVASVDACNGLLLTVPGLYSCYKGMHADIDKQSQQEGAE